MLPVQVRLLIVKDLRLFRRDPVQWGQFLIFFGLLALYFLNIRRFSYEVYYKGWVNMVSFLNVSVVGLLLSTFTTRFIFPMISLESQRFWMLGLLPVRRETILWSKFAFAVGGSIIPCSSLILLSDAMLGVSPKILASHQLTCVILCFGLSGIAVGLGAKMPSLNEQSPSRIAAGFGGTLNLVFSTLYILVVVLLTAVPVHFYLGGGPSDNLLAYRPDLGSWLQLWLVAGTAASIVLGLAATVIPLHIGFRAFRRIEF
jgi:ABC-2 type transport system permease protein